MTTDIKSKAALEIERLTARREDIEAEMVRPSLSLPPLYLHSN